MVCEQRYCPRPNKKNMGWNWWRTEPDRDFSHSSRLSHSSSIAASGPLAGAQTSEYSWTVFAALWDTKWVGGQPATISPAIQSFNTLSDAVSAAHEQVNHIGRRTRGGNAYLSSPSNSASSTIRSQLPSPPSVSNSPVVLPRTYPSSSAPQLTYQAPSEQVQPVLSPPVTLVSNLPWEAARQQHPQPVLHLPEQSGDLPSLGTWAHRQVRILHTVPEPTGSPASAPPASNNSVPATQVAVQKDIVGIMPSPFFQAAHQQQQPQPQQPAHKATVSAETQHQPIPMQPQDDAADAAWRWRFTRRWAAAYEQADDSEHNGASVMEDALQYLAACGATSCNMQIRRTDSESGFSRGFSGLQPQTANSSLLLGGELMLDSAASRPSMLTRQSSDEVLQATREVAALNKRAHAVLRQQLDLERAAEQRCRESMQDNWLGTFVETVEIDDWGCFRFVMFRIVDKGASRQLYLIRGRNYCTEPTLVEETNRQVMKLAMQRGLHAEPLQVVGGGVMDWRRDRAGHLHIHSAHVTDPGLFGKRMKATELLRLAGVLAKQKLPPHYKVTEEGAQGHH